MAEPAHIHVSRGPAGHARSTPPEGGSALLRLGTATAWRDDSLQTTLRLLGEGGAVGRILLHSARSEISVPADAPDPGQDVHFMLTVSSALLLARRERALIHAASVAPPGGPAILLTGDARAGKSTTTANLVACGWDYLSDDQVVLSWEAVATEEPCTPRVEGWLRTFHLDRGWREGRVTGQRTDVDPTSLGGSHRRQAPLGGLLFPFLEPGRPTALHRVTSADALARLMRQSPWLFADPVVAGAALERLRRVAQLPAHVLRLGMDVYRDPARLGRLLEPVVLEMGTP
ncbi:MAG: hypothetical protein JSU98_12550 [Gemmatimonadales bacterium]|nr:MAG: hypothetical protein JSU98_12550 [Gemmatimonadales bacterium]